MTTVPHLNLDYRFPTVYDNLFVGVHKLTIDKSLPNNDPFPVATKPRNNDPQNIKRGNDINAIFKRTLRETGEFITAAIKNNIEEEEKEKLILDLKSLVQNYESILDYAAHYIAQKCQPQPDSKKVHFPIAKIGVTEEKFKKYLSKNFPNLENSNNNLFENLLEIQYFKGDFVLSELNELLNAFKHRELANLEYIEHDSLLIMCGDVGLRLGELGLTNIHIDEGGEIFIDDGIKQASIKGPLSLSLNNYSSVISVPNIKVIPIKIKLLSQTNYSKSIAGQVLSFSASILKNVNDICSLY